MPANDAADERHIWVERSAKRKLTDGEILAVRVVCDALGLGPWNVFKGDGSNLRTHGLGARVTVPDGLATFDQDHLTRLVFAAHDRCARVEINHAGPGKSAICVWQRSRAGSVMYDHPTLEQAVATWRKTHEAPEEADRLAIAQALAEVTRG